MLARLAMLYKLLYVIVSVGEIKFLNLSNWYLRNYTILWCILTFCFIRNQYIEDLAESTDSSGFV